MFHSAEHRGRAKVTGTGSVVTHTGGERDEGKREVMKRTTDIHRGFSLQDESLLPWFSLVIIGIIISYESTRKVL